MKAQPRQSPRHTWPRCQAQLVVGGRWMSGWARPGDVALQRPELTVILEGRGYRTLPADRVRLEAA